MSDESTPDSHGRGAEEGSPSPSREAMAGGLFASGDSGGGSSGSAGRPSLTSARVRSRLLEILRLDLIGPRPMWETDGHDAYATEILSRPPSRWYLTGFLVPVDTPVEEKEDPDSDDDIDSGQESSGSDDGQKETAAARRSFFPSSLGVSFLVPSDLDELRVSVSWGDYRDLDEDDADDEAAEGATAAKGGAGAEGEDDGDSDEDDDAASGDASARGFERMPRNGEAVIALTGKDSFTASLDDPQGGMVVEGIVRPANAAGLPAGTRSVSLFLINRRIAERQHVQEAFAFQAALRVQASVPFVPRPDPRGSAAGAGSNDHDERVADLQYRDCEEFAVGHGVSADAIVDERGKCREIRTEWIPSALVERVDPAGIAGVELSMEALAACKSAEAVRAALGPMVEAYAAWIEGQAAKAAGLSPASRADTAVFLVGQARMARDGIEAGLAAMDDPLVLRAFRIANEAMAMQARRRDARSRGVAPEAVDPPRWRPFQIAFLLLAMGGVADPASAARERVDLLFFPTGGGKTEAYLGLAAFTIVLRRLRNPGIASAGVSVLMRYTLRLLTLDQLGRAAALICALEMIRDREKDLGDWPFEIGLWVGSASTPNRLGRQGDSADSTAVARVRCFQNNAKRYQPPVPLEACPWCGERFKPECFRLEPNAAAPTDLRMNCANFRCDFTGDRFLPVVTVDEPLYRRLPCFVVATVDKFAALPWVAEAGALFGGVQRFDHDGFYGPASPGKGKLLPKSVEHGLLPPDLVIQDELHLISGPLGTIAGIYESAIESLCTHRVGDREIRPKIVASTATIRRANEQIAALFDRHDVCVFPPPAVDRRDSFFATGRIDPEQSRLYAGIAAPGRSMKVAFLRTCLALLAGAGKISTEAGGAGNEANPADPYLTLLGYFNSLRELGGSRRIVEDDVVAKARQYGRRRRIRPAESVFRNRRIEHEPLELTSRVSTGDVAEAKRRLAVRHGEKESVDVALATNMISVGLDIVRLGLMVVLGQPKTAAEYIQATSRVGRMPTRPGLVVTLLNPHKPRDRSHYERFAHFHSTFYRSVESTSVTPWTPRALDRALAAAVVAMVRHQIAPMTPSDGAIRIREYHDQARQVVMRIALRARHSTNDSERARELEEHVRGRIAKLLDEWERFATTAFDSGAKLRFESQDDGAIRLLRDMLDKVATSPDAPERLFRANRSMRDVEPSTFLFVDELPPNAIRTTV